MRGVSYVQETNCTAEVEGGKEMNFTKQAEAVLSQFGSSKAKQPEEMYFPFTYAFAFGASHRAFVRTREQVAEVLYECDWWELRAYHLYVYPPREGKVYVTIGYDTREFPARTQHHVFEPCYRLKPGTILRVSIRLDHPKQKGPLQKHSVFLELFGVNVLPVPASAEPHRVPRQVSE
jgi:hypothetical protein